MLDLTPPHFWYILLGKKKKMQNCIWLFFWETKRAPSVISVSGGFMHLFFLLLSRRAWFVLNCHVCSSTILYVFLYGIDREGKYFKSIKLVSFSFSWVSFNTDFLQHLGKGLVLVKCAVMRKLLMIAGCEEISGQCSSGWES